MSNSKISARRPRGISVFGIGCFLGIPKGFCPPARGCEERATPGLGSSRSSTPTGLWPAFHVHFRNPVGVDPFSCFTQGSLASSTTLGCKSQPCWGCKKVRCAGCAIITGAKVARGKLGVEAQRAPCRKTPARRRRGAFTPEKNVTAGGWAAVATGEKPGSSTADGSAGGPPGGTVGVDGRFGQGTGPKAKGKRETTAGKLRRAGSTTDWNDAPLRSSHFNPLVISAQTQAPIEPF